VELCNPAMARILGLSRPQAAAGRHLGAFYQDRALWDGHLQALQRGESVELDALRLDRGGSEAIVMARLMMVAHPGARAELHACFMDVTALKHAQQELFDTLAENRLLSRQNLRIQEAERRNLARELHDELGQYLNAIKIDAVTIRDNSARELPELRDRAASIVNLSSHVYRVVRDIMGRLRPVGLDELGLVAAMRHCVDGWRQRLPGTTFDFVAQRLPFALDETVTITLYRVMQECLTNVAKHAGATRVAIRLEAARGTGGVRLTVADNGRGVDGAGRGRGLGLPGMRERVEALGGSLMFDGTAGKGVTVTVSIPVACGVEHECEPE
jgi:signal transduction histidine kinase